MSNTHFTEKYISDAKSLVDFQLANEKSVTWESPSNIALIKYWGKFGDQLPQNPSLSFTLKNSKTVTTVVYCKSKEGNSSIEYFFEDQRNVVFEEKIKRFFEKISIYFPFVKSLDFKIQSRNTFPHSAGIASSASSFSALALSLCSIENDLFQSLTNTDDFYRKASYIARLGSGSACRSTYGKVVEWGKSDSVIGSSNEFALPVDNRVHNVFKSYFDAILIIDSGQKELSSTKGHELMHNHPFAEARYKQASDNLQKLLTILEEGDEHAFAQIVENEAMTLHGLMLSSSPFVSLLKPNTLTIISKLMEFRREQNVNFTFTLDAGPNIHILYPESIRPRMINFINSELKAFCENGVWIDDSLCDGPKKISN
jgi:diphosphomevalonate decarboxylase